MIQAYLDNPRKRSLILDTLPTQYYSPAQIAFHESLMPNLFEAVDPRGFRVVCSEQQWQEHVLAFHEDMEGQEAEVKAAIEHPSFGIYRDANHPDRDIYYRLRPLNATTRFMKVVVVYNQDEGYVLTAFPAAKPKAGEELIWPKSKT